MEEQTNPLGVLESIISSLQKLSAEDRERIIKTVLTYFDLNVRSVPASSAPSHSHSAITERASAPSFSDDRSMSAKEFMHYKQPGTDVERAACLAFYLTHYRGVQYFKTIDISQLNTEAAQPKFSNATYTINNATQSGYLVPGPKGTRQISGVGERFVQALPNRMAAKEALTAARKKRRNKKTNHNNGQGTD